jgi:hypothetical protein
MHLLSGCYLIFILKIEDRLWDMAKEIEGSLIFRSYGARTFF